MAYTDECYDVSKGQPISLSGEVRYVVFPGPPNFEDVQKGDEPEPTYLLVLDHPICIRGDEFSDPAQPFDSVQLVGNKTTSPQLKSNVNKRVTVTLSDQMGASTGHHHAPLVAWVTSVTPTPRKLDYIDEYGSPATMIRAFYELLGDGQGDVASRMVVPEKRSPSIRP